LNLRDIEAQAKAIAPVIKAYISKSMEAMSEKLHSDIDARITSLNESVKAGIADIPAPDIGAIVSQVAELIPAPVKGEDGKSVTIEEIQPMIDDAAVKAVANLPVPKDGQQGEKGEKGEDGASISQDAVRAMINEAVAEIMRGIKQPADGAPGRDALDIDLMAGIDEQKTYQRGSWATHRGGIWRAHSTTDGMRGWECVVDGITSYSFEQVDARNCLAVAEMASGKVTKKAMVMPTMIYCGVFRDANTTGDGQILLPGFNVSKNSGGVIHSTAV